MKPQDFKIWKERKLVSYVLDWMFDEFSTAIFQHLETEILYTKDLQFMITGFEGDFYGDLT